MIYVILIWSSGSGVSKVVRWLNNGCRRNSDEAQRSSQLEPSCYCRRFIGRLGRDCISSIASSNTGTTRTVTTNESGVYRFPLLPLGNYRITVEAANFKKRVQEGITLATGQIATVDLNLEAGEVQETVTVSSDTSIADAGKTDLGRVMNNREVHNVPLITRNPYTFGFLQTNVTGHANRGFGFPFFNANGYVRRFNFLLDGNTNTQGDQAAKGLMMISEIYISEVQLVPNAFAAEFGNTPGLIMNVVTPAGTNEMHGAVTYRFRIPSFYTRPFFYPVADLPDNHANDITAAIGGAFVQNRLHFYFGSEYIKRDDRATASRLLTIKEEDKAQLIAAGLSSSIFPPALPTDENPSFYIFRTDAQLDHNNHLTTRVNHSRGSIRNFTNGGLNTLDRSADTTSVDYGAAVQLSSYTQRVLNEFRFQYAQRSAGNRRNELSGTGPSIVITGVANFGSPEATDTIFPLKRVTQIQDNLTRSVGTHVTKFGGGIHFYNHTERSSVFARYTFSSIPNYVSAKTGVLQTGAFCPNGAVRCYASYAETFGDPEINYKATFWSLFLQDDWKMTRRLKVNYGFRYDLYQIPRADPTSLFPASQRFAVDKNNVSPRLGIVYALREGDRPTIIRAGAGIYFDQPLLAMYQRALQNNGGLRFLSFTFTPASVGSPAFPGVVGSLPVGSVLQKQNIDAVSPEFENMYAIHSNIQIEQALAKNLSLAVGYVHSSGCHIPIYRNINPINPIRSLADGRPVFSSLVSAASRLDPNFNNILMVESVGVSRYDAFTLQLTQRFSRGLQFSANYTLSKATDDAPEQNMAIGFSQGLVLSDPTNRRLDKGRSFADQRHTFIMSMVARPQFKFENKVLRYLFNHNLAGIIANANSGETFNIISGLDLNRDGVSTTDRPVGITRNSGTTPSQFNVDLRYSRFFDLTERFKLEAFAEFQNLFNTNTIILFNNTTVATDPNTGELTGPLPDFRARNQSTSLDSRQAQIGIKFIF